VGGEGLVLGDGTVRANQYTDPVVAVLCYGETAQFIRREITIAKDHRLSLFGTADAARYLSEPPGWFSPLRAAVSLPLNGSTVHGKQVLDVVVSDLFNVTKVDYSLSGPGLEGVTFASGSRTYYGWIGGWNTSTVPNGRYTIEATVYDSGGQSVRTRPVEVRVDIAHSMRQPGLP